MNFSEKLKLRWDLSLFSLVITNIIVIVIAIIQKWDFPILFSVYIAQTQIIAFFYFFKIIFKKNTITYGLTINKKTINPTITNKLILALLYYGGFYLVMRIVYFFAQFLSFTMPGLNLSKMATAFVGIVIFFINHLISFIVNFKIDSEKEETLKELMIAPYLRIIPIIIISFFGILLNFLSIIFLILKAIVDIYSHNYIHQMKDDYLKYKVKNKTKENPKTNLIKIKSSVAPFVKGLVIYWIVSVAIFIVLLFLILGAIVNFWFYIASGLSLIVTILLILVFLKHFKRINESDK
ncbi:MAG TPA: DUF6498-containing protein [archaeon]|nr:DUF6498-containing protein [archaeon]